MVVEMKWGQNLHIAVENNAFWSSYTTFDFCIGIRTYFCESFGATTELHTGKLPIL
jgi:hypothetical protein